MADDEVDFAIVNAVNESWNTIKKIPNHVDIAGELLFRKIFEIAPPAIGMFSFGPEFANDEEGLYKSQMFKAHAAGVVTMLDAAVNMLGPDLEPVSKALTNLGASHVAHGVLPAHYGIVGEALLHTLATALGDKWTPLVKKGWTMIFGFVSTAMMAGAHRQIQRQIRRKDRISTRARKKIAVHVSNGESKTPDDLSPNPAEEKRNTSEILFDLTGVQPQAPSKKLKELTDLIDNDLVIDTDSQDVDDDLSLSSYGSHPADSGPVNYSRMVESVYTTWDIIKKIPNYAEVAGVLVFTNIFEIAPQAKGLFPFAEQYGDDTDALLKDPTFLKHAKGVVMMLDLAVNMLGPDLEPVTEALEDLGARHAQYGIIADHYPIVGEALLKTLEAALGDKWTPTVKEGWTGIYGFVSISMQRGSETFIQEELDAYHEI